MQFNVLAPLQAILRPKNQFALFFVAFFVAKLLHLGSHFSSLPIILYLLYFPTFLLPDVLLLVGSKLLVYRHNGGQASTTRKILGAILALFTAICSASQISFFVETGGEIQWMAASRVMGGSGGMGLLLSGLPSMIIAYMVLYAMSLVISPKFYDLVDALLERVALSFRRSFSLMVRGPKLTEEHELLISVQSDQEAPEAVYDTPGPESKKPSLSNTRALILSLSTVSVCAVVAVLQFVRPRSPPYAHMSGSLPITLIEAALFQPINSEFCLPHPVEVVVFPFDRFTKFFNPSESLDWFPQSVSCKRENGPGPPPWVTHPGQDRDGPGGPGPHSNAPWPPGQGPPHHGPPPHGPPPHGPPPHGPPPHGPPHGHPDKSHPGGPGGPPGHRNHPESKGSFSHLIPPPRHGQGRGAVGESICEPIALSNLPASIAEPIAEKFKGGKPKIKNIVLLTLESTRKDIFPLMKDSHVYKTILSSYSNNGTAELDAKLRGFADNAAFLTGQPSGFGTNEHPLPPGHWRTAFKDGMGIININGAITQAAYTLKSLLSSHCGVEPLAVDFAEETKGLIYQPCLPQIFDKMSSVMAEKNGEHAGNTAAEQKRENEYHSSGWESTFVQSVTDQFDNQNVLNTQMGFKNVITENTISEPTSKHYPPKQPWANYFGYPEDESLEYLRDLFVEGKAKDKRLFVSHLTSTPHHPFKVPKAWEGEKKEYFASQRWRLEDPMGNYLNTIQYQDQWISQIFQMLKDTGALEETLVVLTGDHGLAFNSPDGSQSAVNNGHVSNFRIPMLFVHPDLPRLQVNASTTPLSIIPTVLDLLLQSDALPEPAADIAKEILPKYQGHSLIRNVEYSVRTSNETYGEAFFQPFHFGAINPGGSLIAISDASTTYRLILPLCSTIPLRFTDIASDPYEANAIEAWTMDELSAIIKVRHGARAKEWAQLAGELGRWWVWKQREKWGYWGNARETSRGGAEVGGAVGRIKKKHWWETK